MQRERPARGWMNKGEGGGWNGVKKTHTHPKAGHEDNPCARAAHNSSERPLGCVCPFDDAIRRDEQGVREAFHGSGVYVHDPPLRPDVRI